MQLHEIKNVPGARHRRKRHLRRMAEIILAEIETPGRSKRGPARRREE